MSVYTPFAFVKEKPVAGGIPTNGLEMFFDGTAYGGSGNWIDSINGYSLTPNGVTYDGTEKAWEFGGVSSHYLKLPTNTNPITGASDRTLIAYVKVRSNSRSWIFLGDTTANGRKWTMRSDNANPRIECQGVGIVGTNYSIPLNTYTMHAATLSGGNTLYFADHWAQNVNESTITLLDKTGINATVINTQNTQFALGQNNFNGSSGVQSMDGWIKHVLVYTRALSSSEIQTVFDELSTNYV